MSQLAFWQKSTLYPVNSYILDGAGNIQHTTLGGTSGSSVPTWSTNPLVPTTDGTITDWTWVGFGAKTAELQKPTGNVASPFIQKNVDAISFSTGTSADAGKIVLLNASGQLDASMGGGGGGGTASLLATPGTPVTVNGNAPTHAGQLLISQPGNTSAVWADPLTQGLYGTGYPVTTLSAPITAWSISSNVVTFTAVNAFVVGSLFSVFGLSAGFFLNGQIFTVATASGTQFTATFTHANTSATEAGTALTATLNPVLVGGRGVDGNLHAVSTDNSGSLNVNVTGGSSGVQFADNSASGATPTGTLGMGWDAVNSKIRAFKVDAAQNLFTAVENTVSTGGDSPSGGTDGGNPVKIGGVFNTTQPTVTNGQRVNLQATARGAQIVATGVDAFAVNATQTGIWNIGTLTTITNPVTVSGTVTANQGTAGATAWKTTDAADGTPGSAKPATAIQVAGTDGVNLRTLSTDSSGVLNVNAAFGGTVTTALPPDRTVTGSITNTQSVTLSLTTGGGGALTFNATGTWGGTLTFEASTDGTNWYSVNVLPYPSGASVTSATANGTWLIGAGGLNGFRVRGNTVTSGTVVIWIEVGAGSNGIIVVNPTAANFNATVTGSVNVSNFPVSQAVVGNKSNNAGVPGSTNLGVLPAVSTGAAPTYTEGDQVALSTDNSGNLRVNQQQYAEGTAVASATGTIALAKNVSNVTKALLVDASNNLFVSDLSDTTISGTVAPAKLAVVGGKTNDGTPQYQPIPLNAGGAKVFTTDAADGLTGVAVPGTAIYVGGLGADGFLHGLSTDNSGVLNVNATFSGTVNPGFVSDRTTSGSITNTQNFPISTLGAASVVFNITGTWTGTIVFEGQMPAPDNSWVSATVFPVLIGGASVTQSTGNGQWQIPVGGLQAFRVRGNTVSSGTAIANLEASAGAMLLQVAQLSAANLNATVAQGTAGSIGQSWFTKVTDGSNVLGSAAHPFVTQDVSDGTPSATAPLTAMEVGGVDNTGKLRALSTDASGNLNVNATFSGTVNPGFVADRTNTGSITNTQNFTISAQGAATVVFNITGTWTGTIVFEASLPDGSFQPMPSYPRFPSGGAAVTQTTGNGQWIVPVGGLPQIRVRGNTVASGTAVVSLEAGSGAQLVDAVVVYRTPPTSAFSSLPINFTSSGDNIVIPAIGGQTIRVFRIFLVVGGKCNMTVKDSTPASFTGPLPFGTSGATLYFRNEGDPHFVTASGKAFVINLDTGVQVSGKVDYIQS